MHWYESTYCSVCDETKYLISIEFKQDEKELRDDVVKCLRSKGLIGRYYNYTSDTSEMSTIEVSGLTLNLKNTLTAYLQGILDGVSSCEQRVQFLKRQVNSVYGAASLEKPQDKFIDIKKALDDAIKVQSSVKSIDSVYELTKQVDVDRMNVSVLIDDVHELEESQKSINAKICTLRQRTLRTEEKLDAKAKAINEAVDEIIGLQHKVDELEAYLKFIHPQYPFVLDDITGGKKKKGWFKK